MLYSNKNVRNMCKKIQVFTFEQKKPFISGIVNWSKNVVYPFFQN